jgi:hypothetical protein
MNPAAPVTKAVAIALSFRGDQDSLPVFSLYKNAIFYNRNDGRLQSAAVHWKAAHSRGGEGQSLLKSVLAWSAREDNYAPHGRLTEM